MPVTAKNPDYQFLEFYCKDTFGSMGLEALVKLQAKYAVGTGKAAEQIDETTLREIANHFRPNTYQTIAGDPGPEAKAHPSRASSGATKSQPKTEKKPKQSTERGEGRAKLIAALTKHHQYANGGCLNPEPIGNNELAKAAGVSNSTASAFFNNEFEGHTKYKVLCRDSGQLAVALKVLNGDVSPHHLYGRRPANEDDRNDA
jgi:hypothetical protein